MSCVELDAGRRIAWPLSDQGRGGGEGRREKGKVGVVLCGWNRLRQPLITKNIKNIRLRILLKRIEFNSGRRRPKTKKKKDVFLVLAINGD